MAKLFEWSRFIIIIVGAFLIEYFFGNDPILTLHYLMPVIVLSLSGLTGIEGLFFNKQSALSLGRQPSPYQYQSAMNNLTVGIMGLIVFLANWGQYADAAMLMTTLLFITLSGAVHTWEAFKMGNRNLKNMMRGIWCVALLALCVPILIKTL